jgi:hypothetical protein
MNIFEEDKKFWLELESKLGDKEQLRKSLGSQEAFDWSLRMYFTYKFTEQVNNSFIFEYNKYKLSLKYNIDDPEVTFTMGSQYVLSELARLIQNEPEFNSAFEEWLREEKINDLLNE